MFKSIRWRIALPYVALIAVVMLALGVYLSRFVRENYQDDIETQLATEARMLGITLQAQLQPNAIDPAQLDQAARQWRPSIGARITVIDLNGVVIGESDEDRTQMSNHSDRPEVIQALQEGQGSSVRFSHTLGYDMLYTAVLVPGKDAALAVIRLAVPLNQVQAKVRSLQTVLLSVALVITIFALLLAAWIAGRISNPLQRLTRAARAMTTGDPVQEPGRNSRDEVGQLTQAFNIMTVRLQEQFNALEAERGKLAAVLEKMTDGVLIVDEEGFIRLLNPAAEQMFNLQAEHALNQRMAEVLRHHQPYELWQRCQESSQIQHSSFEIGKRLALQCVATPLGKALQGSTLLLFQDITRQQQIETMRRDFISNVSHELRTPLAAIKALSETLRDGAMEDPPAARRFLDRMETEVDALSLMVTELLELSRIESGRVPLELKPVCPIDIITPAFERLCLQAERAQLTLEVACPDTLPLVLADKNRLQQVLVNLIHNAIKFTPPGGRVTIGAELDGAVVRFWVRDTGIGISAEDLPRIFERFYKVDRARSGSGTGLGLAIARHMIEAHRGKIWAESEVNRGSAFYFTLPVI